jgi:hypothetical protein
VRRRWRRLARVHFADGSPSIEGVVLEIVAGHYRVANAQVVQADGDPVPLDGEAWIPTAGVLFVQVLS